MPEQIMRYFIGFLCVAGLGVGAWLAWRYEVQLNEARVEAEQLKRDRDMAKAIVADMTRNAEQLKSDRDTAKAIVADMTRNQADFLGKAREGEVFPRPALEPVPDLQGLAGPLGFHTLHVYRWRGGTLEGWVQFQTEAEPVKQDLEVSKRAKLMAGEKFDPRAVSGVIVFAFKARKDEPSISDCIVGINQLVRQLDKNGVPTVDNSSIGVIETFRGAIDSRKTGTRSPAGDSQTNARGSDNVALWFSTGLPGGEKKYQVYELKLSPERGK
jgi:hypothetical protein